MVTMKSRSLIARISLKISIFLVIKTISFTPPVIDLYFWVLQHLRTHTTTIVIIVCSIFVSINYISSVSTVDGCLNNDHYFCIDNLFHMDLKLKTITTVNNGLIFICLIKYFGLVKIQK